MEAIRTDCSSSSPGGVPPGSSDKVRSMTSVIRVGFPRNLNFSGVCFHSRVPLFQSMIGFSVSSQGKPKIRCCFPSPEIRNWVFWVHVPKVISSSVEQVMVPFLFRVPSTLNTTRGCSNFFTGNQCFRAKFWSMKVPPAPESMRAFVSTVFPSHEIRMGICIVLFEISASVTE